MIWTIGPIRSHRVIPLQQATIKKKCITADCALQENFKTLVYAVVQGLNTMRTRTTGDPASTATTLQHRASCCPMPNTSPTSQMMRNVSPPAYTSMVVSTSTVNGIGRINQLNKSRGHGQKRILPSKRSGVPMATLLT